MDGLRTIGNNGDINSKVIVREIEKVRAGFMHTLDENVIASGDGYCGKCSGNPYLRMLVQWIAASTQGRDVMPSSMPKM